ncbi:MAG: hypothetical protein JSS53_04960 [Proteobacteria bacterium]|nr:hypothetical protein [Pseudomonadota bacterium]
MKSKLQIVFLILLSTVLTACGFHLRQSAFSDPSTIKSLYIQTSDPYSPLVKDLTQVLKNQNIQLANTPNEAQYILTILNFNQTSTVTSVGFNTQIRQNLMIYTVEFEFKKNSFSSTAQDSETTILLSPTQVSAQRQYTQDNNQMLGSESEKQSIEHNLRQDVIQRMLFRVSSALKG